MGDASNCFDGVIDEGENLQKARIYWENNIKNARPYNWNTWDGDIVVEEIVENYK